MTAQLVGAWAPPGRTVSPRSRAMLRAVTGVDVVEGDHFWLAADQVAGRVAAVGLMTGPEAGWAQRPEGQYAMASVDASGDLRLSRSVSGGERLFVARVDGDVVFASSLRPLLHHPDVGNNLDRQVLGDLLLNGHPLFGTARVVRGIDEVMPGHDAVVEAGRLRQRWTRDDFLRPPEGDVEILARQFRERLCEAVELAIGDERPVAIALSGGIDSSAIAAAAVEVVPAAQIRAYSWEFDDPTHPVETPYARMVSQRLGIEHHDVFSIDGAGFLSAIPEHVWRSESAVHWPKAFLLQAARSLKARGHGRYLTGFGIGSHMAYLRDVAMALRAAPHPAWLPPLWRKVRFEHEGWPHRLERLHPGLEPPHPRLYSMLVEVLAAEGIISDHRAMFPDAMHPLLPEEPRNTDAGGRWLGERLQKQAFSHLVSCIDVTRSEKASREVGIHRIAPAHFRRCLPYAYLPLRPAPPFWSADRRNRPGKLLLKHAYRGILPDEVLFRVKSWADAVISPAWRRRARVHMLRALPHYPGDLGDYDPRLPEVIEFWEPRSIQANCLSQRFFLALCLERSEDEAPTWSELWRVPEAVDVTHDQFVPDA